MLEKHPYLLKDTHIIHSQATPVDDVHIGFVVTVDLSVLPTDEFDFEDAIGNVKQMTARELRAAHDLEGEDRLEPENCAGPVVDKILSDAEAVAPYPIFKTPHYEHGVRPDRKKDVSVTRG